SNAVYLVRVHGERLRLQLVSHRIMTLRVPWWNAALIRPKEMNRRKGDLSFLRILYDSAEKLAHDASSGEGHQVRLGLSAGCFDNGDPSVSRGPGQRRWRIK